MLRLLRKRHGILTNPGNAVFENDPGVIGTLFIDPNSTNPVLARSYVDRAYLGKIQASYQFPSAWGRLEVTSIANYPDGFPFARELLISGMTQGLRLNARLVTLSVCNTAVGPIIGDGTSNLVLAFIQAGAQSVVSTLWEIEDSSTGRLMKVFYRDLARGEGRAESLREAQLELLRSGTPHTTGRAFKLWEMQPARSFLVRPLQTKFGPIR